MTSWLLRMTLKIKSIGRRNLAKPYRPITRKRRRMSAFAESGVRVSREVERGLVERNDVNLRRN